MKRSVVALILAIVMSSCVPDNVKEKINEGMMVGHRMLADQEFKRAVGNIELHKLRNGTYPKSLSDLKFLSALDSAMFSFVEYTRLDSVYELNVKIEVPSITEGEPGKIDLRYPAEFWNGLGCVKSNVK
jgi:hypothetical protein